MNGMSELSLRLGAAESLVLYHVFGAGVINSVCCLIQWSDTDV